MVSVLTRLIQPTQTSAKESIEYEYRDAEYEYEANRLPAHCKRSAPVFVASAAHGQRRPAGLA